MPVTMIDNPSQRVIFGDEPMIINDINAIQEAYDTLLWAMKEPQKTNDPLVILTKYGFKDSHISATFIHNLPAFLEKVKNDFFIAINIGKEAGKTIVEIMGTRSNDSAIPHETIFKQAFKSALGLGPEPAECDDPQAMD
jgi:hypothetical protein